MASVKDLQEELVLAEFNQLYQQIRGYETGLLSIYQVSVTAAAALLAAIFTIFWNAYSKIPDGKYVPAAYCYLFLAPAFVVISGLMLISDYRSMIYRAGYYIQIFIEQEKGGARWHMRLEELRNLERSVKGRALDRMQRYFPSRAVVLWVFFIICLVLFVSSIAITQPASHLFTLHFVAALCPLLMMIVVQWQYTGSITIIKAEWQHVRRLENDLESGD